jgi:hypothetical protein
MCPACMQFPCYAARTHAKQVGTFAVGLCGWYFRSRHWLANNVLGCAMSLEGIEFLNVGSVQVGAGTPRSVYCMPSGGGLHIGSAGRGGWGVLNKAHGNSALDLELTPSDAGKLAGGE